MRKTISTILLVLYLLVFIGCQQQQPDKLVVFEAGLEDNTPDSYPTEVILHAEEALKATISESTEATTTTVLMINSTTETTAETETTDPTQPSYVNKDKSPTKSKSNKPKTSPSHSAPTPTVPQDTQPESTPTTTTPVPSVSKNPKPETETTVTTPTPPKTELTQPETKPSAPEIKPTEPTGCAHGWKAIHHKEKGHWKAGIVCDCGWTLYGNADELISQWNAHSASYPAEEALFEHGGYGSADKWIVDEPAYDEWVCRHCGEPKS